MCVNCLASDFSNVHFFDFNNTFSEIFMDISMFVNFKNYKNQIIV